ncbi:MAG: hypothetical protein IH605_13245 [Burkholderiales bacterium]|nr:hypothetical protein [Burkholderiales bacterium]
MLVNDGIDANYFSELSLYQELLLVLSERASAELSRPNSALETTQVARWFGLNPPLATGASRGEVAKTLRQLKSTLNTVGINVKYATLKERDRGTLGSALPPQWGNYTISGAEKLLVDTGGKFVFTANSALLALPPINTDANTANWGQSCFANFIHEMTHAFLNTDDVEDNTGQSMYGPAAHLAWVANGGAKLNDRYTHARQCSTLEVASNWGFFVEDLMTTSEREAVSAKVLASRKTGWSAKLREEANRLLGVRAPVRI